MKQFDGRYEKLLNKILKLEKKLKNADYKEKYIEYINSRHLNSVFWWENIKTLDKFEKVELDF